MLRLLSQMQSRGFSLVELLVVVSIISIAISITVPLLLEQVDRVKSNEAKNNLADLYSAEEAFFLEWGEYGSCLITMGLNINIVESQTSVQALDRTGALVTVVIPVVASAGYYVVGFKAGLWHSSSTSKPCGSATQAAMSGISWFNASKYVGNYDFLGFDNSRVVLAAPNPVASCVSQFNQNLCRGNAVNNTLAALTGTSFVIQASGNISRKPRMDKWTINHHKNLKHVSVGY